MSQTTFNYGCRVLYGNHGGSRIKKAPNSFIMKTSTLDSFRDVAFTNTQSVTGGSKHTSDPSDPFGPRNKGNNGLGQEKRGIIDGPPPGLVKNGKGDFNDDPLNLG